MTSQSWLEHALRHSEWRPTRTAVAMGTLFLFVGIIIGALYLTQSSNSSQVGRQIEDLIVERNELERVNEQLRAEIASLRGVGRLLGRAGELGFVPAGQEQILYVVVDNYQPDRNEMALAASAAAEEEEAPIPAYEESFVGWAQQQFDSLRSQIESFAEEAP
jgi:hypothetical protein